MKTPTIPSNLKSKIPRTFKDIETAIPAAGRRQLTLIREQVLRPLAMDSSLPEEIREEANRLWWLTYDKSFRLGENTLCISGGNEGELYGRRIGIDNSAGLCYAAGRSNNQDALLFSAIEDEELTVVADGLGGHLNGEKAAKIAVEMIGHVFRNPKMFSLSDFSFLESFKIANESICFDYELIQQRLDKKFRTNGSPGANEFPGATAVAALWKRPTLSIASIGDSRAYLFKNKGKFSVLAPDEGGLFATLSCIAGCSKGSEISKEDFQTGFGEAGGLAIYDELEKGGFIEGGRVKISLWKRGMDLIFARELQMGYGRQAIQKGDIFWQVMKRGVPPKFPISGKLAESYYRFSELFLLSNTVFNYLGNSPFKGIFTYSFRPVKGDILLLASDGLNALPFEELRSVIDKLKDEPPEDIAGGLYDAIRELKDNTTIAVSKF
ncbi:MAG: protein phosphatase 2C domain-containing protein [Candidatus Margulisbacteria bacterium]|nr:protein phosphatase 2C domain-containing protein [Candidatus Margulisiibacteriota bacterium]